MGVKWIGWDESMVGADSASCTTRAEPSPLEAGADEASFEQAVEAELRERGHEPHSITGSPATRWVITWAGWMPGPQDYERGASIVADELDARICAAADEMEARHARRPLAGVEREAAIERALTGVTC